MAIVSPVYCKFSQILIRYWLESKVADIYSQYRIYSHNERTPNFELLQPREWPRCGFPAHMIQLHSICCVQEPFGVAIQNSRILIKLPHIAARSRTQAAVTSFTRTSAFLRAIAVPLHCSLQRAAQAGVAKPKHCRGVVSEIATKQSLMSCLTCTTERFSTDMKKKCYSEALCMQWGETSSLPLLNFLNYLETLVTATRKCDRMPMRLGASKIALAMQRPFFGWPQAGMAKMIDLCIVCIVMGMTRGNIETICATRTAVCHSFVLLLLTVPQRRFPLPHHSSWSINSDTGDL